jgi:predicted DNA-binding transcriptional regulator AlpA
MPKKSGPSGPKPPTTTNYRVALAAHARASKNAAKPVDPSAVRPGRKLLDKKLLLAKILADFVTINAWIIQGRFPKPCMMGGKSVWWEDEVDVALGNILRERE